MKNIWKMKNEMTEPIELLYQRVVERQFDILYNYFDDNYSTWGDEEMWFEYIKKNINNLLNEEEKQALIQSQIKRLQNEDMNSFILSLAILAVVVEIVDDMKFIITLFDTFPIEIENNDYENTDNQ